MIVRLEDPPESLAESGRWSLAGVMAERENTTWRMAAEFLISPDEDHELKVGSGYV